MGKRHFLDSQALGRMVVDVSKRFLKDMSVGFEDERVNLKICDGCEFIAKAKENSYDAIIVDSSDPVGPAMVLYKKPFFDDIHRALKPGGILCNMAECVWLHMDFIREMTKLCGTIFVNGSISYAYACTPSYPW